MWIRQLRFAAVVVLLVLPRAGHTQTCGNGVIDPGEDCDLGFANCPPAVCCPTSCSSNCQLLGRCTNSQGCCTVDADCPAGEGCCGNAVGEGNEQCDDGNRIDADCCSASCQLEPAPCVPLPASCGWLGPLNVVANPSIRRTLLRDAHPADGVLDVWVVRDQFNLADGLDIDPDTEIAELILNENDGSNQSSELYHGVLDPVQCPDSHCFVPDTNTQGQDRMWTFRLSEPQPDIQGAPGWRFGRYRRNLGFPFLFRQTIKVGNTVVGTPTLVNGIRRARQSVVIGDVCVTRLLDCERNDGGTRFVCREVHCGDGQIQRGERCGEPGLPACNSGKVCDGCRCVRP